MLKIVMIRHFATEGNLNKRYIGVTDEPLCETGKQKLQERNYPLVEAVFTSPLKRCLETAGLIYPNHMPKVVKNLAECNFGDFENKNYMELSNNSDYQAWIDSGGMLAFPKGENLENFKARCIEGFHSVVKQSLQEGYLRIAMVVHGGTIMSILEKYSYPQKGYYHWQVENGGGFLMELDVEGRLINLCDIL
jgi:alpha-ribazole phosphatase